MDQEQYESVARAALGDQVAHVAVIWPVKQMRVLLADGTRVLLDHEGNRIGRALPPES